jgi:NTE family protein
VFDGLPATEVAALLARLETRVYTDGATVIAEGDHPHTMYVIADGLADIVMSGRDGEEHSLNRLGAGAMLGEMSLLTGEPASATVRAVGNLTVLVLNEAEFHDAASRYPRLYQNLGAMLALRVASADRRVVGGRSGTLTVLQPDQAPQLLSRALAASVAWHTRQPTLLLILDDAVEPSTERPPGAHITVAAPAGPFAADRLVSTVEDLRRRYDHVLIQTSQTPRTLSARNLHLIGAQTVKASQPDQRPGTTLRAWSSTGANRIGPDRSGVLHVPALSRVDENQLENGWLPPTTPAGKRLGWAARDLVGLKVGLALGGGGLKGYAHLGVLRVFERVGVPVDFLSGTSIGGVVASLYALDHGPEAIADILDAAAETLVRPALSTRSLLSDDRLRRYLRSHGEHTRFEDLRLPLALVAADIVTGHEVVFQEGLVWPASMATVAIPGLFPAQSIGPYWLIDGGVLNPVPADVASDMGADVVIAVRLRSEPSSGRAEGRGEIPSGQPPSVIEVITRAVDLMQARVAPRAEAATTVLIQPRCEGAPGMGLRNFNQGRRYIQAGEAAAEEALPRLNAVLPWLSALQ